MSDWWADEEMGIPYVDMLRRSGRFSSATDKRLTPEQAERFFEIMFEEHGSNAPALQQRGVMPHDMQNEECPINKPNFGGYSNTAVPCFCSKTEAFEPQHTPDIDGKLQMVDQFRREFRTPATISLEGAHVSGIRGGNVTLTIPNMYETANVLDALARVSRAGIMVDADIYVLRKSARK
jgi:hypothetical protein